MPRVTWLGSGRALWSRAQEVPFQGSVKSGCTQLLTSCYGRAGEVCVGILLDGQSPRGTYHAQVYKLPRYVDIPHAV